MRHTRMIAAAAAVLATTLACGRPGRGPSDSIPAAALASRIEAGNAPVILDVRTPEEFGSGHVPGAVNIPHTELADRLEELGAGQERELVVYCERGRRAGIAESILRGAGFSAVRHLEGDMSGWRGSQLPVEGL